MSIQILHSPIQKFTHIIHIADIHIRLTQRHDEYKVVFENLYEEIKKSPSSTLICVVGDVVHSKLDLSPECVQEAKDFLQSLAKLRPTILTAGNHDTNLSNKSRLDSLSPIIDAMKQDHLFYLKSSGLYSIGNILFNNYSVFDGPDKYIQGPDIPSIYRNQHDYFIVLFHGAVHNSNTYLGYKIVNTSFPVTIFDGHDLALLGDIHMKQDLQEYNDAERKPFVHYCGSLVQQNHGESLHQHGLSLWDLNKRKYTHIEIPNDYGYFTVQVNKGVLDTDLADIPKKTRLRMQCFESVPTEVKAVLTGIRLLTEVVEVSYIRMDIPTNTVVKQPLTGGNISLKDLSTHTYQNELITQYLKTKHEEIDEELINKVLKISESTNQIINKEDCSKNIRWKAKRFEWDNMFSYGEENVIDFTKLHDVVGLFAPNTSGKSTLLSALSFCIFDKCDREFKASNIINVQKMNFRCKFNFEIDGVDFFIEKSAKLDKKGNAKVDVEFWKTVNDKRVDLNEDDRRDTGKLIREYLGTYEDFVLTTLSVQNTKNAGSFIDMGHTERKDLLAQFMGLDVFDKLHTTAAETLKELSIQRKQYKNDDFTQKLVDTTNALSQSESAFNDYTSQVTKMSQRQLEIQQEVITVSSKLIRLDEKIPPIHTSKTNKSSAESNIQTLERDIQNGKSKLDTLRSELSVISKNVDELAAKNIQESYKEFQSLCKQRDFIRSRIEKKKIEVSHKFEKINKAKGYEFNPDCEFCIKNADVIVQEAASAHQNLKIDKNEADELVKQLNEIKENVEKLSWSEQAQDDYNELLENRNKKNNEITTVTDKIVRLESNLSIYSEKLKDADKNIALYLQNEQSLQNNDLVNNEIETLKLEIKNLDIEIKSKNKLLLDLNGKMSVYKNQIEEINTKIANAEKTESEFKAYELYVKSVSRDGVPYEIISDTIPQIEGEINTILSQIVDFTAKIEMDGKNVVPYIVYDEKKWPMGLTSGFEKFVLSLAIRVALINISNLPRPNFMVIDEGFGVIDSANLPSVQILFSYLKHSFDFIIIVSHLDALRDMVDNHLEIKKENGFSTVKFE